MRVEPLDWWTSKFSDIAPIGHALRRRLRENWARFHSLPESKRYAESESEFSDLLQRHLAVANELFEMGEPIYLFRSHLGERKLKGRHKHQIAGRQLRERVLRLPSGLAENAEEDDIYFVRALVTSWVPDFFDEMTRQIADWKETGVTLVSPLTMNIYSPYDGGMDIFVFSMPPESLEDKFKFWMSGREDKL